MRRGDSRNDAHNARAALGDRAGLVENDRVYLKKVNFKSMGCFACLRAVLSRAVRRL